MPELPEVETIRRIIERELVGRTLIAAELRLPKLLRDSPIATLEPLLGRKIVAVRRRAKVLTISFDGDLALMAHFKLSGQLVVIRPDGSRSFAGHPVPDPTSDLPHRSTHVTFQFDDGTSAHYSDIRQFGWFRVMPEDMTSSVVDGFGFGPEGTGADPLDPGALSRRLARRSIPIKAALLDQRVVAGLGNIYVDEALFAARIHPARPSNTITDAEVDRLVATIPWALDRGIEQGGAKIIHGKARPLDGFPAVHGREHEPCIACGDLIVKTRVGGRGTYYCPSDQPDPPGWIRPPASAPRSNRTDPDDNLDDAPPE